MERFARSLVGSLLTSSWLVGEGWAYMPLGSTPPSETFLRAEGGITDANVSLRSGTDRIGLIIPFAYLCERV